VGISDPLPSLHYEFELNFVMGQSSRAMGMTPEQPFNVGVGMQRSSK
jgi:hypothetical protein